MNEPDHYSTKVTDYGVKVDGNHYGFIAFEFTAGTQSDSVTFFDLGPWGRHRSPVDDPAVAGAAAGLVAIPVLVMLLLMKGVRKWWTRGAA